MMHRLIPFTLFLMANCGRPPLPVGLPAPNPNGCYVTVFDRVGFRGIGDVWNGPGRWASLEDFRQTRRDGWRNRIRSLRVGHTATVTVFTDVDFRGESRQFPAGSEHAQLDATISARVESLEISCP
jgi:hypothetical protein